MKRLPTLHKSGPKIGLMIAAVAGLAGFGTLFQFGSQAAVVNPSGNFYVVGSDIVDPTGKVFYPVGFNVGVKNAFDGNSYNTNWAYGDKNAQAAVDWGVNIIRPNYLCSNKTSYSTRLKDGYATLKKDIDGLVKTYTAKKVVVMLECHDGYREMYQGAKGDGVGLPEGSSKIIKSGTRDNTSDIGKNYRDQMDEFWTDMAKTYKDNPYVWFNFFNEPLTYDNAEFQNLNQRFYTMVRNQGAENVMIADGMSWGQDGGGGSSKRLYDDSMLPALVAGRCNIVGSVHDYASDDYNRAVAQAKTDGTTVDVAFDKVHRKYYANMKAKNLPLIVGEAGYTTNGSSTANTYAANKAGATWDLANLKQYGYGFMVWHATFGNDNYSLKANSKAYYTGTALDAGLSDFGQRFWDYAHSARPTPAFTGSYKASNCASANTTATTTPAKTVTPTPTATKTATPAATPTPLPTPTATAVSVDDATIGTTSGTFSYTGTWTPTTGQDTGKYADTDRYSSTTGSVATFKFTGTRAWLYGAQYKWHGIADVSIDGGTPAKVDYYDAARTDNQLLYTSPVLTAGAHTLTIKVTGTKDADSTGTTVTVDRVAYQPSGATPVPTASKTPTPSASATPSIAPMPTPGTASGADLNGDGRVNILDLSVLLSGWGKGGASDINKDGTTNVLDLSRLLSAWG